MRSASYLRKIIREAVEQAVTEKALEEKKGKKGKKGLSGACWPGYEAYGMKDKDGRQVPNCVPKSEGVLRGIIESLKEGSCDECGMNEAECECAY